MCLFTKYLLNIWPDLGIEYDYNPGMNQIKPQLKDKNMAQSKADEDGQSDITSLW